MDKLVIEAMRLAEYEHRSQKRKAPDGEYRPAYFIHLVEVAGRLTEAGSSPEVVAAGYLHDIIEDTEYSREQLAAVINNERVAELVEWVSEPEKDRSWEERNATYLERMKTAPSDVLDISCADKTCNIGDMIRFMKQGHKLESFVNRGFDIQRNKFENLRSVFDGKVNGIIFRRFCLALEEFIRLGSGHRQLKTDQETPQKDENKQDSSEKVGLVTFLEENPDVMEALSEAMDEAGVPPMLRKEESGSKTVMNEYICPCLDPKHSFSNEERHYVGVDETKGRFADVHIIRCNKCQRNWIHYHVEFEAFTASGRWYRALVTREACEHLKPENAESLLKSSEYRVCGGSLFGTSGVLDRGNRLCLD